MKGAEKKGSYAAGRAKARLENAQDMHWDSEFSNKSEGHAQHSAHKKKETEKRPGGKHHKNR